MARSSIEIRRCDRCGHECELRGVDAADAWSKLAFIQESTAKVSGLSIGVNSEVDLCQGCGDAIVAWWLDKAFLPLSERQDAAPARERVRAALSLADIQEIKRQLGALICANVATAFQLAVRSPDAFADGQAPALPVAIIQQEAADLIDDFIAQHGLGEAS